MASWTQVQLCSSEGKLHPKFHKQEFNQQIRDVVIPLHLALFRPYLGRLSQSVWFNREKPPDPEKDHQDDVCIGEFKVWRQTG